MKVFIPSPLHSYTGRKAEVEAEGKTLADLLAGLDRRYPGFRFRIVNEQGTLRKHIKIFINEEQAGDLTHPLRPADRIHILCALSGGSGLG